MKAICRALFVAMVLAITITAQAEPGDDPKPIPAGFPDINTIRSIIVERAMNVHRSKLGHKGLLSDQKKNRKISSVLIYRIGLVQETATPFVHKYLPVKARVGGSIAFINPRSGEDFNDPFNAFLECQIYQDEYGDWKADF